MSIIELSLYLLAIVGYFLPYYIALYRNINGKKIIFWLNLLLGWTFVAWILLIVASISVNNSNPTT